MRRLGIILLALSFLGSGHAYDPDDTHPEMSRLSIRALVPDNEPSSYDELRTFARLIQNGSGDEDGFAGHRGPIHFFNPLTNFGLIIYGFAFDSALQTATPLWQEAIDRYQENNGIVGKRFQRVRRDFQEGKPRWR
jgi:hypothetical protein